MPLDLIVRQAQKHLILAEKHNEDPAVAAHLDKLHRLLEQGVSLCSHELTARGVDVRPLSGGGNKPPVEE